MKDAAAVSGKSRVESALFSQEPFGGRKGIQGPKLWTWVLPRVVYDEWPLTYGLKKIELKSAAKRRICCLSQGCISSEGFVKYCHRVFHRNDSLTKGMGMEAGTRSRVSLSPVGLTLHATVRQLRPWLGRNNSPLTRLSLFINTRLRQNLTLYPRKSTNSVTPALRCSARADIYWRPRQMTYSVRLAA